MSPCAIRSHALLAGKRVGAHLNTEQIKKVTSLNYIQCGAMVVTLTSLKDPNKINNFTRQCEDAGLYLGLSILPKENVMQYLQGHDLNLRSVLNNSTWPLNL